MPGLLLLITVLQCVPPLDTDERALLATAVDGEDHREPAWVSLVEHVARWTRWQGLGQSLPGYDEIEKDPDTWRGELFILSGTLLDHHVLERPYDIAEEWWLRDAAGEPILVYVVQPGYRPPVGEETMCRARYYKQVGATARDVVHRFYPAFVGRSFRLPGSVMGYRQGTHPGFYFYPLVGLLLLFYILLRKRLRRSLVRSVSPLRRTGHDQPLDERDDLPEDPAEALRVLKRQAKHDADD